MTVKLTVKLPLLQTGETVTSLQEGNWGIDEVTYFACMKPVGKPRISPETPDS